MPAPFIVTVVAPFRMAETVALPALLAVSEAAESLPIPPMMPPALSVMAPVALSKSAMSSVPPLMATRPVVGRALAMPSFSVPRVIVVPPVKVLALLRVSVPPAPFIVRVDPPARIVFSARLAVVLAVSEVAVSVVAAELVRVPLVKVTAPPVELKVLRSSVPPLIT